MNSCIINLLNAGKLLKQNRLLADIHFSYLLGFKALCKLLSYSSIHVTEYNVHIVLFTGFVLTHLSGVALY